MPSLASTAELAVHCPSHPCPGDSLHVSGAPMTAEDSTVRTMQALTSEQDKAEQPLQKLSQWVLRTHWMNSPASSAYWVCVLLLHLSPAQLRREHAS